MSENTTQLPSDPRTFAEEAGKRDPAFREPTRAWPMSLQPLPSCCAPAPRAGLTQTELAERMGVSQPVVARIEGSIGSRKHAPSLATLRKYADACGQRLVIRFEPKQEHAA